MKTQSKSFHSLSFLVFIHSITFRQTLKKNPGEPHQKEITTERWTPATRSDLWFCLFDLSKNVCGENSFLSFVEKIFSFCCRLFGDCLCLLLLKCRLSSRFPSLHNTSNQLKHSSLCFNRKLPFGRIQYFIKNIQNEMLRAWLQVQCKAPQIPEYHSVQVSFSYSVRISHTLYASHPTGLNNPYNASQKSSYC